MNAERLPGRWWAVPAGVLTWALAEPGPAVLLGAVTSGVAVGFAALWLANLRDAHRCRTLAERADPDALGAVDAVVERLDPHRRVRIVVDPAEATASMIPAPRPVIAVSPRWLEYPGQLAAVVAHEYGHVGRWQWLAGITVMPGAAAGWWLTLAAATLTRNHLGGAPGAAASAAVVGAGLWCTALAVAVARSAQRRHEFEADATAASVVGAEVMADTLRATGDDHRHVGAYSRYPLLEHRLAALDQLEDTGS